MAAPVLSHLDPDFIPLLHEVGSSLRRLFRADDKALALATSGTGTSAMEAAVANIVADGMRGVVIVTGYFGDRLAQIFERYGATVRRIDVEWGRAVDPQRLRDELRREGADVVGMRKRRLEFAIQSGNWRPSFASMERYRSSIR
jgi:alanine-glyoxylate transaminase/serine-glyoxylate transaminase/serine-pyruvate transaminase